ncbi:hypothetical protein [Priestia megaterium]|uniref:hypothetical protein n=1 Tax=Priestia megaterium TaxID=1404 RepID=UPI002877DB06|nr:hypothetical protein [Priestia megaterium]
MKNKQFYTYKFKSSRLKEFDYNITLDFDDAVEFGEVIALFDNQMLRSIRKIKGTEIDDEYLNELNKRKNYLKKQEHSIDNAIEIKSIQDEINRMLFIPEYITIVMDSNSHYDRLYKKKLILNNKVFVRFSSSAGQARVSTVVFVEEKIAKQLQIILDNGRNLNKKLVPSKYNAYKGLSGSSTLVVSTPKFCVVPDYESESEYEVNYVTETSKNEDDHIEVKKVREMFNRFDGQGIISYEQSKKWAEELGLDYVPAQWCVRQNFIKGMLNTFDIKKFCKEINGGNHIIETSYTNEDGTKKTADLSQTDVILSESQFKLWDSWDSVEIYQENCEKNELYWGVSLHSPKKDKDMLKMNYQFLQTLNLNKSDIEEVCSQFVKWINGVSHEDSYYTLLFLLGSEVTEEKIKNVLAHGDNHWLRSLMVNPDLMKDKHIKRKVYDLIKRKIKAGCMGQILVDGNFQTLVSDPYGMMQHICGLEVTGLLKKGEHFSHYWNKKGVKVVDSMRAPLTYRSEHVLLNLQDNEEVNKWYKYSYTGIIVNIHGVETVNWAGSDFDYDIVATTSNETIIKGVYKDELPITYEAPKSNKKVIKDEDLFKADKFSFGSIIGGITNKSTGAFALLADLKEGTREYETTLNRIKMCTKLQSAQIDKAKIGRKVKGIPPQWVTYQRINPDDSEAIKAEKQFLNNILLDRHPYFFRYLYKDTNRRYKKHYDEQNATCQQKFGMTIDKLKSKNRKSTEELEFLSKYQDTSPIIDSDCVMNNICHYIESVDFNIRKILKDSYDESIHKLYMNDEYEIDDDKVKKINKAHKDYNKMISQLIAQSHLDADNKNGFDEKLSKSVDANYNLLKEKFTEISSNVYEIVNCLVHLVYEKNSKSNKEIVWELYGDVIFENVLRNTEGKIMLPMQDENGEIEYLGNKYNLKEVIL